MIKISDRLMLMASQIRNNETMADIGTDHGFLPMYLADAGICKRVILTDVSKGSLEKGRSNVERLISDRNNEGKPFAPGTFDFRLGNGIEIIEKGEVDVIAIAGMGGILISEIINSDLEKSKSFKRFVLQPRNNAGRLRFELIKNGFSIEKNLLVREGKFICDVIVAVPDNKEVRGDYVEFKGAGVYEGDITYEMPEDLLENGELAVEFIKRRIVKESEVLRSLTDDAVLTDETINKKKRSEERIIYLKKLIGE